MTTRPNVVLFRTPVNGTDDEYHVHFSNQGYKARSIPVLSEEYVVDKLANILRDGGAPKWQGVIVSSRRGAEAWLKAASQIGSPNNIQSWSPVPLFAVGRRAAEALSSSTIFPSLVPHQSADRIAKSAKDLIPILTSYVHDISSEPINSVHEGHTAFGGPSSSRSATQRPFLIIRGDKSLDALTSALRALGCPYKEVIVYKTSEDPDLAMAIRRLMEEENPSVEDKGSLGGTWLCFFAPSSAEMVLSQLGHFTNTLNPRPGITDDRNDDNEAHAALRNLGSFRIAAIGQTTETFLEERGLRVHATASEPNAESLVQSIAAAEDRIGRI